MIREAAQAIHHAINAAPTTPSVSDVERILTVALGSAASGHVTTRTDRHADTLGPVTLRAVAHELARMAAMRTTCDAIERAWLDAKAPLEGALADASDAANELNRGMLERLDALAATASLCEARTASDVFLQAAFAEHLYDASAAYEGPVDLTKFELAQSLQHAALRGLLRLGALDGRRPDLVQPFCRVREPLADLADKVERIKAAALSKVDHVDPSADC